MQPDNDVISEQLDGLQPDSEQYEEYNLNMDDQDLINMLIKSLDSNIEFWNRKPWNLSETDKRNIRYLLGEQEDSITIVIDDMEYNNNRLFTSVRAILSYATGQLAIPELTPSSNDPEAKKLASGLGLGLYEHSAEEDADDLFRVALMQLITRKRAYIKQRFDENAGTDGDLVSEICNPEDVVIDRYTGYKKDPNILFHKQQCSVDDLVAKFPDKEQQIYNYFNINRGVYTQMSRMVTHWEAWFGFWDGKDKKQGVAWFLPGADFLLDKMLNPNWIYKGSLSNQKDKNFLNAPPKPFTSFNYFNLGRSAIDETCLFDQAVPLQRLINKRLKQITDNADYVNGRWVYNKGAIEESDAKGFTMAKAANSTLGIDSDDVNKAIVNISSGQLPSYVYESLLDAYTQLDTIMGTPSQFRGEGSDANNTLGKDQMIKQQAGMLQDDLVRAVNKASKDYYKLKLHLMNVYYTDNHKFGQKGGDGNYRFFLFGKEPIDKNIKINVQVDSTLPIDKASIRALAESLAKMNRIDNQTLFEDLGLKDAEMRVERLLMQTLSPLGVLQSVKQQIDNNDAEMDILLVAAGTTPEERSNYDEPYLNYFNNFMTTNRFAMIQRDAPLTAQRLVNFLQFVQQKAAQSANLQGTQTTAPPPQLDDAGLLPFQAPPIIPNVRITGALSQGDSEQMARIDPKQDPAPVPGNTVAQSASGYAEPAKPV